MWKYDKILNDILSGKKDYNINFNELCKFLDNSGFALERISGSHHIFSYKDVPQLADIQPDKKDHSKAKAYQIRQIRKFNLIKQTLVNQNHHLGSVYFKGFI